MASVGTYGFINAKVRAMRSYLLSALVYRSLAASKDIKDLFSLLSQTRYRKLVEELGSQTIEDLERALFWEEIEQLRIIEKFSKGRSRTVIRLFLERYDSERVKKLLRVWHSQDIRKPDEFKQQIVFDLPVDQLLSTSSLSDWVDLLDGTPFKKVIEQEVPVYEEHKNLFRLEIALDRDYYGRLWKMIGSLSGIDRRIAQRLVGIEIDLRNLDWIVRFRKYYQLGLAEIVELLLPYGLYLGDEGVQQIASGENLIPVLSRLAKGLRLPLLEDQEGAPALEAIERFLYQVILMEVNRSFREFPLSIGSILGYYYLVRIEVKNLRTLVEAKRFGLTPQKTESLLVM
jgi:V/A-type H+-transporting ATPase subunit C